MATPTKQSPAQRMAEALLGGNGQSLRDLLDEAREAGESYERIARRLATDTEGVVDVSGNTLRNWHAFYEAEAGAA